MARKTFLRMVVGITAVSLLVLSAGRGLSQKEAPAYSIEPTSSVKVTEELLTRGAEVYRKQCSACHGATGKGDGPAAYLLYPKPRNFVKGQFRFVSTWDGIPTDEDLFRVISRGIPGSAMPSWAHLSETDRWALVHYTKKLSPVPFKINPTKAPNLQAGEEGEGIVDVPEEPANTPESIAKGAKLFAGACSSCHGPLGEGNGPQADKLKDDAGFPIRPRNLNSGVFKGYPKPDLLYRRVVSGIPGTPMPATPNLIGADAWHLVHYVRSLSSDHLRDLAEMKRFRIFADRVTELPDHPDSGAWNAVPSVNLHLMPLWWRYNRPEYVTVQAVHNGGEIAILLMWADETHDTSALRPQDFRDGAAIQFALTQDPPFFAMGEMGKFVNIWMWKSDRQADLAAFQDIDMQYPNTGIDSYPNLGKSPYEQPMRHALTLQSDPTFITGWGAGNIVSDPTRPNAAEDLSAQGFGTLKARPWAAGNVWAKGVYDKGSYRIMFRRALKSGGLNSVDLTPGTTVPVGIAIWNGASGDRDGKKSVTIWQDLVILP